MVEILGSLYDTELEYDDFKNKLQELITEYVHLSRGSSINASFKCIINNEKELIESISYDELYINERVVRELYEGNNSLWFIIFYELELLNQRYLIFNGISDENTIKVIKEMIINSQADEWSCLTDNVKYSQYSSELAMSNTFNNIVILYKLIGQELSVDSIDNFIKNEVYFLSDNYNNDDFNPMVIEGRIIEMDSLFDKIIYYNSKWLEIFPQLQIEYYIDNNGCGVKRDYLDLLKLKTYLEDDDKKQAIYLINKMLTRKRKILS